MINYKKLILNSARVYRIPWAGKNQANIEEYRYPSAVLKFPKKNNSHLFLFNLQTFEHKPYIEILSKDENDRLKKIMLQKEKKIRTKSRILLRMVLAEYLTISPSKITFTYGKNGKPKLKTSFKKISFNVSHSLNYLAVLIDSHRDIGVDIESETKQNPVITSLAKRFFNQEEFNAIINSSITKRSVLFNRIWTLKEAVLKSSGIGISNIEKAPDFSFLIKKDIDSNLQYYTTKKFKGYTFHTNKFCLSTSVKKNNEL